MSDLIKIECTVAAMKHLIAGIEVVSHDKRLNGQTHVLACKDSTQIRCRVDRADGCFELTMDI